MRLVEFAAARDENVALGFSGAVSRLADAVHQLETFDDESEYARETPHFAQDYSELRTDQSQIVVALLTATHPDATAGRENFRVVRHEEALLEYGTPAAAIVQFEIARYYAFVLPTLEYVATLITDPEFARRQHAEVFGHLRSDVAPHFDQYAPERRPVDFDVEIENRIYVRLGVSHERRLGGMV